ncbi:MAG: hypothetical protein EA401_01975, partial [Planctomycetota bacterium]
TGRILSTYGNVQVHELTQHAGFPYQSSRAAFRWRRLWPWFPSGTVHCCCLDPQGQGPIVLAVVNNHVLCGFEQELLQAALPYGWQAEWYVYHVQETQSAANSFRARDILAPFIAAMVKDGSVPPQAQTLTVPPEWPHQRPIDERKRQHGTVIDIDSYGNIITDLIHDGSLTADLWQVRLGSQCLPVSQRPFADHADLHARIGCDRHLVIAIKNASAAHILGCSINDAVLLSRYNVGEQ